MNALERARQVEDRFRAVQEIDQLSEHIAWADRQLGRLKSAIDSLVAVLGPVEELVSEGRSLSAPNLTSAREALEEVGHSRSGLREDVTRAAPQDITSCIANLESLTAGLSSWSSREWGVVLAREDVPSIDEDFVTKLEDAGIDAGSLGTEIASAQSRIDLLRMLERPESGSIARLHEAATQLRVAVGKLQHLLPEEVFAFIAAAVETDGAHLSMLTDDVRDFLTARSMEDRYRIVLR